MANYWQTHSGKPERIPVYVCRRENLRIACNTAIYHIPAHVRAPLSTLCKKTQNLKVVGSNPTLSLPFIPSCLPTTARLSGTDIILSQRIL